MFYKCSDPRTSTRDWFSLVVDSIPQPLIKVTGDSDCGGEPLLTEILNPPVLDTDAMHLDPASFDDDDGVLYHEPDRDEYDASGKSGDEDTAHFLSDSERIQKHNAAAREWRSEREGMDLLPMWGTMFRVEDHEDTRAALAAEGLRVYEHAEVNGILFGVEGCGYDFYGAHWIPLRARLALDRQFPIKGAKLGQLLKMLRKEAAGLGDKDRLERVIAELRPGLEKPARVKGRQAA